jgi:hypothetical protein
VVPGVRPVTDALIEVSIALVTANGVPFTAVKVSKLKYFEYTKPLRELLAPALITEVNFTEVSVISVAVSEIILGMAEVTAASTTFPMLFPDSFVASKRK